MGSTNSLLLQQKDRYSDILINLDEDTITITSPSLKNALALTAADRRWIDYLTQEVSETWDEANPSRPKNMQYVGSEEFIRSQFEAYMLGLISSVKYHNFLVAHGDDNTSSGGEGDPAADFGLEWVEAWTRTENYRMWNAHTDANLFAVSEPKHPCAGGLTIDDVQRRIAEQLKDLHLDERFAQGREVLGRNFAAGREKASTMFNKLYSDVEYLRETQRRRAEDSRAPGGKPSTDKAAYPVDLVKAQQTMNNVGAKASAYMSSWAAWAGEKKKTGGWGVGWGKKNRAEGTDSTPASPIDKDYQMVTPPGSRTASTENYRNRPTTQASFSESILSRASDSQGRPTTGSSGANTEEFYDVEDVGSGAGKNAKQVTTDAKESKEHESPAESKIEAKHSDESKEKPEELQSAKGDGFQKEEVVGAQSLATEKSDAKPSSDQETATA